MATPRDLGRLRDALAMLPELVDLVRSGHDGKSLAPLPELLDLSACLMPALAAIAERLSRALVDDPPGLLKDGGAIRTGYDATVDDCRKLADGGKEILAIEEREQASGIANPVRYNRVRSAYIEITKDSPRRPREHIRADVAPASATSRPSSPK